MSSNDAVCFCISKVRYLCYSPLTITSFVVPLLSTKEEMTLSICEAEVTILLALPPLKNPHRNRHFCLLRWLLGCSRSFIFSQTTQVRNPFILLRWINLWLMFFLFLWL